MGTGPVPSASPLEGLKKAASRVAVMESCSLEEVPCSLMWDNRSPSVTVSWCFRDGVAYEPRERWGISHLLAGAALKGTKSFPSAEAVAARAESVGGKASAFSTRDMTGFCVKTPAGHEDLALDLLLEVSSRPLLTPEIVEAAKDGADQGRLRETAHPGRRAAVALEGMLLEPSPSSRHPAGSRESLAPLDAGALRSRLADAYGRRNMAAAAAGGLSSRFKAKLSGALGRLPRASPAVPPAFEADSETTGMREAVLAGASGGGAVLSLGWRFPVKDRSELALWRVLCSMLGSGSASLLDKALGRRDRGHGRDAASFNEYQGMGVLKINIVVPALSLAKAAERITAVVRALREGSIDEAAFKQAAVRHYAAILYKLEDSLDASRLLAGYLCREGRPFSAAGYLEELAGASPRRAAELAARHLAPATRKVLVIGDSAEALKAFPAAKLLG